jgi:hypothetical protein
MEYPQNFDNATVNLNFLPVQEPIGQTVELFIQCRNLSNMDFMSKSDP